LYIEGIVLHLDVQLAQARSAIRLQQQSKAAGTNYIC
jgi:hypothetical protein